MQKRFIAIISLVVVLVSVVLAVVIVDNKKEIYVDEAGVEHWIYRNDDGHTVLNGAGDIVVYATDANGRRQKDENGEYVTAGIEFPSQVISDNTLETPDYRLTLPKDWKLQDDGQFVLKDNKDISISILNMGEIENTDTLDTLFEEELEMTKKLMSVLNKEYPESVLSTGFGVVTMREIEGRSIEYKMMKEKDGEIVYYANTFYFVFNNQFFQINIACENGSYDESIDFFKIVDECMVMKNN